MSTNDRWAKELGFGWGGGGYPTYDASDTSGWFHNTSITKTATAPPTAPDEEYVPDVCIVCNDPISGEDSWLCELCRQAVLLFRRKVLEQMARELAEM